MKTKIRTYGDKVYTNFRGLNVPEDDIESESFTVISIDSLLTVQQQMADYLIKIVLKIRYYKCCITTELI